MGVAAVFATSIVVGHGAQHDGARKLAEVAPRRPLASSTSGARKSGVTGSRPPPYLPTGPARYSGLEVAAPLLLVFYHVEKTGGSAVMKWLHKMVSTHDKKLLDLTPRLTSLFDFTHTSCLFAQHADLFPGYEDAWDDRRCSAPQPPRWQTAATAVEFHAYTRRRYWENFVPVLPQLRARYAAANGTLLTVTLLREPRSHIMSSYKMWPPSYKCATAGTPGCPMAGKHALSLPWWLPRAVGLQAGSFTLDSWPHMRKGFHNLRGCDVLDVGRQRLATFDVVGVTDCLTHYLANLCHLVRWPCAADQPRLELAVSQALRHTPKGVAPGGIMAREGLAFFEAARGNASVQHDVAVAARCDRLLYADAVRRAGLPVPPTSDAVVDRSLCSRASLQDRHGKPLGLPPSAGGGAR